MKTHLKVGLALVLAVGASGCGDHHKAAEPRIDVMQKPIVSVEQPHRQDMSNVIEIPADVAPWQQARLYAKVAGYLKSLTVDKGDHVVRGQVLATIDSPETVQAAEAAHQGFQASLAAESENQAELARAQAQVDQMQAEIQGAQARVNQSRAAVVRAQGDLALSQATWHRIKSVYDRDPGLVAQQDVDVAQAQLNDAQSRLLAANDAVLAARQEVLEAASRKSAAERQVLALRAQNEQRRFQSEASQTSAEQARTLAGYADIRAPFTGVITARYLDPGALIQNSANNAQQSAQPVVSLADFSTVRVYVQVPESDLPLVHVHTSVSLLADELPGQRFHGQVTRMSGRLDPDTRTMLTEIDMPNPHHVLSPGMLMHADLWLGQHHNVLTVPLAAVSGDSEHRTVFVLKDDTAHRVLIKTGYQTPDRVEVTAGLTGNEKVVVQGKEGLQEGSEVQVQDRTTAAAGTP
ncbi:MAG TPA: efflux RND transporter periplasmic adaptor subunit [Candidatus Xenobia bacterium]|jgi:RND family efflux transporter MFP subunit